MPIENSAFYNLQSRKRLAVLLGFKSVAEMEALANNPKNYKCWSIKKKDGSERGVQKPLTHLEAVHRRIAYFLLKLPFPEYAHAAKKGRSYVTNADAHLSHIQSACLDIKQFYPSITGRYIFTFFRHTLMCSEDVATVLTKLSTFQNQSGTDHLATGSPLSPILSLFANKAMFDLIFQRAGEMGLVVTCYYDDVTVSGSPVKTADVLALYRLIESYGLTVHPKKFRIYQPHEPREVTGVVVVNGERRLPNRRHKAICDGLELAEAGKLDDSGWNQLHGRIIEAHSIVPRTARIFMKRFQKLKSAASS